MEKNTKKKLPFLDRYVILSLSVLITYYITAVVYQFITHEELSPTLTTAVSGAFGGELLMLCVIKKGKLKKEGTSNDI